MVLAKTSRNHRRKKVILSRKRVHEYQLNFRFRYRHLQISLTALVDAEHLGRCRPHLHDDIIRAADGNDGWADAANICAEMSVTPVAELAGH